MTEMFDEVTGRPSATAVLAGAAVVITLAMAAVKVRNELKMTEAYDRQAMALEKIANHLELIP